jgi:putative heme degradation protein
MMRNRLPDSVLFHNQKGQQSSDIGLRLQQNQAEIADILSQLEQSALGQQILDVAALKQDWQHIKDVHDNSYNISKVHFFLRAIMMGMFLIRVEGFN